jgi:hypothetical protein
MPRPGEGGGGVLGQPGSQPRHGEGEMMGRVGLTQCHM